MKEEEKQKKEEAKRQRRCSPVEGLLVLLDLAARQLVELGVHVYELVLLLHLLALLELVVDPLSPAEQATEFGVRWHDPLSILSIRIHVDEGERENSALKARSFCGDAYECAARGCREQSNESERERESALVRVAEEYPSAKKQSARRSETACTDAAPSVGRRRSDC